MASEAEKFGLPQVIIYSNATLLGRITIGKGATIGANVWLTRDVEPGEKVTKTDGTD